MSTNSESEHCTSLLSFRTILHDRSIDDLDAFGIRLFDYRANVNQTENDDISLVDLEGSDQ